MDTRYANIQVFGGETKRLYRETKLAYTVSDPKNPNNYPVYSKDQYLGCFNLFVNNELEDCIEFVNTLFCKIDDFKNGMWKMYFDGASS